MGTPEPQADRQPLTYEQASDEQRTAARERARRRLADAEAQHGSEYYEQLRERFGITEHRAA